MLLFVSGIAGVGYGLAYRFRGLQAAGLAHFGLNLAHFTPCYPSHKQKAIYSLTEASIALVPLLPHMGGWGLRHMPASKELSVRAKIIEDGGPKLWSEFMEELRHLHLEAPAPRESVFSKLKAAYEAAIAKPPV